MDDEKTIADEVAEEVADTAEDTDIDEAKDKVEDAEDIDTDAVRDEIRDEDEDTRDRIDDVLQKLSEIESKLDGFSRMLIDGGAVISDGKDATPIAAGVEYVDFDDMDLTV